MTISTLHVENFAENAVLCHMKRVELKEIIAAVFKHYTVKTRLFREVNEFPDLVKIHCRGHFNGCVFAAEHRFAGHGEVMLPVSSDVNDIDILTFA